MTSPMTHAELPEEDYPADLDGYLSWKVGIAELRRRHEEKERMRKVAEDSRGNELLVEPNEVGGRRYWSTEIGGGVVVWDTALVSPEMLRLALEAEEAAGQQEGRG